MLRSIYKKMNSISFFNSHTKKKYFLIYTVLFTVISSIVFSWYYKDGRTFIGGDGWSQHYKALIYYSRFLRSIAKSMIVDHRLTIPSWDFSIGEGSDILQTLHYYVIGDPFTVFSMFVPSKFMYLYYDAMILLRLYLAGIAFSCLCFYTRPKDQYAILAGALTYVFCYYGILNSTLHPYFLNPLLYFPLLILGIEMILRKGRPYLFIITVFISAVSNFYFFYILAALTAVYTFARLLTQPHPKYRDILSTFLRITIFSVLGVLMAAVTLLPMCYTLINTPRLSSGSAFRVFYPLSYYAQLPAQFLSQTGLPQDWLCMGYTAPTLLSVFFLFYKYRQQRHNLLRTLFLIGLAFILFPLFGKILNGFSYECNRWSVGFALLNAYILTFMWPYLMKMTQKEWSFLFIGTLTYFIICLILEHSRSIGVFIAIILCFIALFSVYPFTGTYPSLFRKKRLIILSLILISIINTAFWQNSANSKWVGSRKEKAKISQELTANETIAIKKYTQSEEANDFYRYSGSNLTPNANLIAGLSSTQFYWSLSNPYVAEFRHNMGLSDVALHNYSGYDTIASLNSLAAVQYYAVPANSNMPIPYGFSYIGTTDVNEDETNRNIQKLKDELCQTELSQEQIQLLYNSTGSAYSIFRNDHALPLTYGYHSVTSPDSWHRLSAVSKQEVLLQSAVLDDYHGNIAEQHISTSSVEVDHTITYDPAKISQQDNSFIVTSPGASITLDFRGVSDSETYFSVDGLYFEGIPSYDLYFGNSSGDPLNLYNETNWDILSAQEKKSIKKEKLFWIEPTPEISVVSSSGIKKTISCYTENNHYYFDRHDFTTNLGYSEEPIHSVSIYFSAIGKYTFDSLHVTCLPMANYPQMLSDLSKSHLEDTAINGNMVTGTISLDQPTILCFAIPYSNGWEAYVDNQKVKLYRTNEMYMGVELTAGVHSVQLIYHTPLLKTGCLISVASFIIFGLMIFLPQLRFKVTKRNFKS